MYILHLIRSITIVLLLHTILHAQLHANDILTQKIEVSFFQAPITTALLEVAHKGGFEWSYNSNILDAKRKVTLIARDQTVREVLLQILGNDYTFKQSGNYLILKKVKKPQQKVSGYLSDKRTGEKIPNATIYDRQTLKSTTTDENGFYELPVTPKSELVVAKLDYRDTVLQVTSESPRFLKIEIKLDSVPIAPKSTIKEDLSRFSSKVGDFFNTSAQRLNELNVNNDSLKRTFQISFLPNIGTNFKMSSNVINDYSLNILAGYSKGNRIVELGGLGNINRGNMSGFQAAGMFNDVNGDVTGVQSSGFYNRVGGNLRGVQTAGFVNIAHKTKGNGVQVAGFVNLAVHGNLSTQLAGFANHVDTITGIQASGFYNFAKYSKSVQLAGFHNSAVRSNGVVQASGFSNLVNTGTAKFQIAGFSNIADTVKGVQVSGFLNRGKRVNGVQIGVINLAKEINGAQIGLLNFSRKGGYIALEASANEIHDANIALKTGTRFFYTIFTAGISPSSSAENDALWSYGMGIGTFVGYHKRLGATFDLVHRHLSESGFDNAVQEWEQFAPALNLKLGKHFSLAAGPTANLLISNNKTFQDKVVPKDFPEFYIGNDDRLRWWIGGNVAVRWKF